MKSARTFLFVLCCLPGTMWAQFAPQAGLSGSTAISAGSSQFVAWATYCTVQRGLMDIDSVSLGYASAGDSSLAIGPADDQTVSLGDSGIAVLTFANPIYNGPGPDFAVFENGFLDPANDSMAFLELGFVEVSSDGFNYFRFPATSLTQDSIQVSNDAYLRANNLNNLAGNYIARYGTPFDLEELSGISGLDINHITHVRIVDVIGDVGKHSSHDSAGRIVNDPFPTPFPSCGFDLDAVGVINEANEGVKQLTANSSVRVFPNPATDNIFITSNDAPLTINATLTTINGSILMQTALSQSVNTISVEQYAAGMYFLQLSDNNGNKWVEKISKR